MWQEVKVARNRMVAEMWKDLLEGEGVPTKILPADGSLVMAETVSYKVYVPGDKAHLVDEILRKI